VSPRARGVRAKRAGAGTDGVPGAPATTTATGMPSACREGSTPSGPPSTTPPPWETQAPGGAGKCLREAEADAKTMVAASAGPDASGSVQAAASAREKREDAAPAVPAASTGRAATAGDQRGAWAGEWERGGGGSAGRTTGRWPPTAAGADAATSAQTSSPRSAASPTGEAHRRAEPPVPRPRRQPRPPSAASPRLPPAPPPAPPHGPPPAPRWPRGCARRGRPPPCRAAAVLNGTAGCMAAFVAAPTSAVTPAAAVAGSAACTGVFAASSTADLPPSAADTSRAAAADHRGADGATKDETGTAGRASAAPRGERNQGGCSGPAAKPFDRGTPASPAAAEAAAAAAGGAAGRGAVGAAAAEGQVSWADLPPGGAHGRIRGVSAAGAATMVPSRRKGALAAAGAPSARAVSAGTGDAAPRGERGGKRIGDAGRSDDAAQATAPPPQRDEAARGEFSRGGCGGVEGSTAASGGWDQA